MTLWRVGDTVAFTPGPGDPQSTGTIVSLHNDEAMVHVSGRYTIVGLNELTQVQPAVRHRQRHRHALTESKGAWLMAGGFVIAVAVIVGFSLLGQSSQARGLDETPERPPITHIVDRTVIETVTVTETVEVPVVETVIEQVEVPVVETVTETVEVPVNVEVPLIDPQTGEAITVQYLWDREHEAYAAGVSDGFNGPVLPGCTQEDSEDCYWDAVTMGNGIGTSFIRWGGVTYVPEVPVS